MTTTTPSPPRRVPGVRDAGASSGPPTGPEESRPARAARLARRRRLLTWSLPVVLVVLLAALKLLTMVAAGHQAVAAYTGGNITSLQQAGGRMGWLNPIERHKAPFALGDAAVLEGDFDTARARFEQALQAAPADGLEACQVRVNLVLSLEKLGDAASAASGAAAAKPFYDRVGVVTAAAPPGCFQPQGEGTGQQLKEAQDRAQDKGAPKDSPQGQDPQGQDPQTPQTPEGSAKEQQLDDQTKDNQAQRAQGDQDTRDRSDGAQAPVAKPW